MLHKGPPMVKPNPFESIWSRNKFSIIGKKRKGEERRVGPTRSEAIDKRNNTLQKEYEHSTKSSMFVDKRIGEQNENLEEFEKSILRSQRFVKPSKSNGTDKRRSKFRRTKNDKFNRSPSPSRTSEGLAEEEREDDVGEVESEEEQVVHREPTIYDNLLQKLGSGDDSIADALRRRHREEEGKSDPEEDDDEELSSNSSKSKEEGSDSESSGTPGVRTGTKRSQLDYFREPSEVGKIRNEGDASSDSDKEDDMHTPLSSSNFIKHLGHQLSQGEIDQLIQNKWTYKYNTPAINMSNCKWRGTSEFSLKESNHGSLYGLKPRLYDHWLKIYSESGGTGFSSSTQSHFFSICHSYRDILHHNKKPFYLKGLDEDQIIADSYLMHSLNHIISTKDLISKNGDKLRRQDGASGDILNNDGFLDQGFTHPKVLIILPLRSIAYRVVKRLIKLTPLKNKAHHLEDVVVGFAFFQDKFGVDKDLDDQDNIKKSKRSSKPSDFDSLFGGNNDDNFMIGIKFSKTSIKLSNKFDDSDMIIASPLGLITKIGEAEVMKEKNTDYLSSIEILIIDHADVILMQNWSHVDTVIKQLNLLPTKQHSTNIMRIRPWYLDGQARFYRQTIILSSHINPDIHATFNHQCVNYEGKVKLACEYKGVLSKLLQRVSQLYQRFDVDSYVDADEARFKYFTEKIFPQIKDSIQGGVMLFMSSYVEFVRLRNFLKDHHASICLIGEYTEQKNISRARVQFFEGHSKILLYNERAHFYHRYKIRGVQNLIIYSLPERKEFYPEIVNMLEESRSCTVLYSRFDQLRLERIVGSAAARNMVASKKGLFVFEYE